MLGIAFILSIGLLVISCVIINVLERKQENKIPNKRGSNYMSSDSEFSGLEIFWVTTSIITFLVTVILVIPFGIGLVKLCTSSKIDQQIEMREAENTRIEAAIKVAVDSYLNHENSIFDTVSDMDVATTVVLLYPDIKSNELVSKQIEILNDNNKEIRNLKSEKIELATWKFLIYFGH